MWKKESTPNGVKYFDIFASFKRKSFDLLTPRQKDNAQSIASKSQGDQLFRAKDFSNALEFYNASLCFAEIESEHIAVAYGKRSSCFYHMGMYDKALNDIELAKGANVPDHLVLLLECSQQKCLEAMDEMNQSSKNVPKLSYDANERFPCLANVVEIKHNAEFGRHLVATTDIPVGKIVLAEEFFVKARDIRTKYTCYNCFVEKACFIPCPQCPDVVFCSVDCMNRAQLHKLECGFFTARAEFNRRFVFKSILLAIATFQDAENLMEFVAGVLHEDRGKLPSSSHDTQSKYHLFLKLQPKACTKDDINFAQAIYTDFMRMPKIHAFFNTEDTKRFFMHLITHHIVIIDNNSIADLETRSLANVMSLANHSCVPNVRHFHKENSCFFETVRPVKVGEQLFITYLGFGFGFSDGQELKELKKRYGFGFGLTTEERRNKLKKGWGFECKCEKCNQRSEAVDPRMAKDPSLKFVLKHFENDHRYEAVLKKCRIFLEKYGQSEMDRVLYIYMVVATKHT